MLKILIVGFNEELNIQKLLDSLIYLNNKIDYTTIYIDQGSTDSTISILEQNCITIVKDKSHGYPEPSKKLGYEEYVGDGEYCLILDCDEQLTIKLAEEISSFIKANGKVGLIPFSTHFMDIKLSEVKQPRIFKKPHVEITNEIHNYIKIRTDEVYTFKFPLINKDAKDEGRYIFNQLQKNNKYTDNELLKYDSSYPLYKVYLGILFMPMIWFFGWGIKRKMFLKGTQGLIFCGIMGFYQFILYIKLYEKNKTMN